MENYDTAKQFHLKSNAFLLKKLPRIFQQIKYSQWLRYG